MVRMGLEPGAAGWKAQKNPLSYGGTQQWPLFHLNTFDFLNNLITRLTNSSNIWCWDSNSKLFIVNLFP